MKTLLKLVLSLSVMLLASCETKPEPPDDLDSIIAEIARGMTR